MVAAAGLKGDVGHENGLLGVRQGLKVALAVEVLGESGVGLALAKEAAVPFGLLPLVDLLRHAEGGPGVGPAGVEGDVGQGLRHLLGGDAVFPGALQVVLQRAVHDSLADEGGDGDEGAELQRELALPGPDLAEEHVVIELGEFGGELPQGLPARGLLHCHDENLL